MPKKTLKQQFKIYLANEGISASDFARRINVSRQYISQVINCKIPFTAGVREKFKNGGFDYVK